MVSFGRARRSCSVAVLAATAALASATAAYADPSDDAVAALRSSSVYVGADSPTIDRSRFTGDALSGVKVAIVRTGGPDPVSVARSIGERLDPNGDGLTVLVFEGRSYGAASSAYCGVGTVIDRAVGEHRSQLQADDDVTATVASFAADLRDAPSAADGCSGSSPDSGSYGTQQEQQSHTGLFVLLAIVGGVILAVLLFLRSRRRRRLRELAEARGEVAPYLDRLAADVRSINPGDNRVAQQAMHDARERLDSASNQLAEAWSVSQCVQARSAALQGLYATRTARAALGLDPGAPLPPLAAGDVGQLAAPQAVNVQGQTFQGYPAYSPAAPYYFGGGYGVPGGWYGVPFWETLLLGSVLAGGFGGFGGWGGYGAGYDNGYLTGFGAGEAAADDSGADGSDGYSGDGSDWGDSGGGGAWGDGGGWGDSGGGDFSGSDFGGGDFGGGDGGGSW
jgi:hypothetical protein